MVGFRNREKKWNVFFAFICVLLFVFLAGMLVLGKKTEKEEQDRLKELAKKKQQPVQEELQKNETTDFLENCQKKMEIRKELCAGEMNSSVGRKH